MRAIFKSLMPWFFTCLLFLSISCGKSISSSLTASSSQNTNTTSAVTDTNTSKTGTVYISSNAASSCLPPPSSPVSTLPSTSTDGATLTKADLSNFTPEGVLGGGFHNAYQVVTITNPSATASRVVALHLWIDSPGQDTVGQAYTRVATVSVSLPGSNKNLCSTKWYPATITYKLSQPLVGDDVPTTRAVGSFTVTVDTVGTGSGTFDASTTATLPVGVDMESCTQTTVGTLPDVHSNGIASPVSSGNSNANDPNTVSAAGTAFDNAPFRYFFYRLATEKSCASGVNCGNGYTVYGALSDDANFCQKIQSSITQPVLPAASRYIEIALDNSEQGLTTLPIGVSTINHASGASGAAVKMNLPQIGSYAYTGTFKLNISDPNTVQFLSYDFTFDPTGQPFERASDGPFVSQACSQLN